jgi:hypothetical protein
VAYLKSDGGGRHLQKTNARGVLKSSGLLFSFDQLCSVLIERDVKLHHRSLYLFSQNDIDC